MDTPTAFNVRCYGLIVSHENRILTLHESFMGVPMNKFPGGGLEFGEGIRSCLDRELQEEFLNPPQLEWELFHIPEQLFVSQFRPEEQIIIIYYLAVERSNESDWQLNPNDAEEKTMTWMPFDPSTLDHLSLETDVQALENLLNFTR